ncbi:MAG: hypothetical protein J0H56_07495 [Micrococcales bacterium]|nr:hypothetical protein [Micrococcales bacterium]
MPALPDVPSGVVYAFLADSPCWCRFNGPGRGMNADNPEGKQDHAWDDAREQRHHGVRPAYADQTECDDCRQCDEDAEPKVDHLSPDLHKGEEVQTDYEAQPWNNSSWLLQRARNDCASTKDKYHLKGDYCPIRQPEVETTSSGIGWSLPRLPSSSKYPQKCTDRKNTERYRCRHSELE